MKKRIFVLFPGLFFLVALSIFFMSFSRSRYDFSYNLHLFQKLSSERVDVIALGDSRVMNSLNPDFFEKENKRALNFAFPTNSYTSYYVEMAKTKLKERSTVLIGISLESLTGRSENITIKNFNERFDSKWKIIIPVNIFLNFLFPRFDFQMLLRGQNPFAYLFNYKDRDIRFKANGWTGYFGSIEDESLVSDHYASLFKSIPPEENIIRELIQFVADLTRRGHKVYFFESPMSNDVLEAEKRGFGNRKLFLQKLYRQMKMAGSCQIQTTNEYKTWDGDHMIASEAERFSRYLAKKIKSGKCDSSITSSL